MRRRALAVAVVLLLGWLLSRRLTVWLEEPPSAESVSGLTPVPEALRQSPSPTPTLAAAAVSPPPSVPVPLPAPRVRSRPSRRRAAAPLFARPAATLPEDDDLEATLLARAIDLLRNRRDPEGALQLLAGFGQHFPDGVLTGEATLVRAEALLRLGRREALLTELSPAAIAGLPRAEELGLLRSEVLAQLGRCPEAIAGLRRALGSRAPALQARARQGLTGCQAPEVEAEEAPSPERAVVLPAGSGSPGAE